VVFDRVKWKRTRQIVRTNILAVVQLTAALVPGMVDAAAAECSTSDRARA